MSFDAPNVQIAFEWSELSYFHFEQYDATVSNEQDALSLRGVEKNNSNIGSPQRRTAPNDVIITSSSYSSEIPGAAITLSGLGRTQEHPIVIEPEYSAKLHAPDANSPQASAPVAQEVAYAFIPDLEPMTLEEILQSLASNPLPADAYDSDLWASIENVGTASSKGISSPNNQRTLSTSAPTVQSQAIETPKERLQFSNQIHDFSYHAEGFVKGENSGDEVGEFATSEATRRLLSLVGDTSGTCSTSTDYVGRSEPNLQVPVDRHPYNQANEDCLKTFCAFDPQFSDAVSSTLFTHQEPQHFAFGPEPGQPAASASSIQSRAEMEFHPLHFNQGGQDAVQSQNQVRYELSYLPTAPYGAHRTPRQPPVRPYNRTQVAGPSTQRAVEHPSRNPVPIPRSVTPSAVRASSTRSTKAASRPKVKVKTPIVLPTKENMESMTKEDVLIAASQGELQKATALLRKLEEKRLSKHNLGTGILNHWLIKAIAWVIKASDNGQQTLEEIAIRIDEEWTTYPGCGKTWKHIVAGRMPEFVASHLFYSTQITQGEEDLTVYRVWCHDYDAVLSAKEGRVSPSLSVLLKGNMEQASATHNSQGSGEMPGPSHQERRRKRQPQPTRRVDVDSDAKERIRDRLRMERMINTFQM